MSKDVNRMNVQENIHPKHFVRIVGRNPLQGEIGAAFHVPESTVTGAFGPPEIDNKIRFWSFATRDGQIGFTLLTKQGRKKIDLVAPAKSSVAYLWTSDHLSEAEMEPIFLGAGKFVLSLAC